MRQARVGGRWQHHCTARPRAPPPPPLPPWDPAPRPAHRGAPPPLPPQDPAPAAPPTAGPRRPTPLPPAAPLPRGRPPSRVTRADGMSRAVVVRAAVGRGGQPVSASGWEGHGGGTWGPRGLQPAVRPRPSSGAAGSPPPRPALLSFQNQDPHLLSGPRRLSAPLSLRQK